MNKIRTPNSAVISPDGTTVAWTVGQELHVSALAGETGDRLMSVGSECSASSPAWSPDAKTLAFLSNCTTDGKRGKQIEVWMWSATSGQVKQLTHLTGAITKPAWSPDGRSIAFLFVENATRSAGATSAMKPPAGVIGQDGLEIQRVARVDAASGNVDVMTPVDLHVYEFSWAPSSKEIAMIAAPPPGENNWWVAKLYKIGIAFDGEGSLPNRETIKDDLHAIPVVVVDTQKVRGSLHGLQMAVPRISPDGKTIAFIGGIMSDEGSNGGDIYLVKADGSELHSITEGRKSTPSWLMWADGEHLIFTEHERGKAHIGVMGTSGAVMPIFGETLPESVGSGESAMSISVSLATKKIALTRQSFDRAPEVWAGGLSGLKQISHLNDGVKPLNGKSVSLEWKNEGFDIQGWLLPPMNYDPNKKYPLIVSVHGGPSSELTARFGGEQSLYSALGYFVLMPNPRGSYGQGEKFTRANVKDFGHGDLRDILAGVDLVEKKYPIDTNRIGITGWSYGGFMTMFAVTQTDRFKAAVAGAGISNWQSYYGENSIDQWMMPFFGASVYDDPEVYAKSSAITYIKKARTPMLIVVGDSDGECPMPQSFEMWHALRNLGVKTELVVYTGEGHHFAKPENILDLLERRMRWFEEQMPAK